MLPKEAAWECLCTFQEMTFEVNFKRGQQQPRSSSARAYQAEKGASAKALRQGEG